MYNKLKYYRLFGYFIVYFIFLSCDHKTVTNSDVAITDLLPLWGDTIIAVKNSSGLLITTNGGEKWDTLNSHIKFKNIIIDSQRILWGLDSWIGIHESSYSRLFFSKDFGRHWEKTEFETKHFFPTRIISEPFQRLSVLTNDRQKYELIGNNPKEDWAYIENFNKEKEGDVSTGAFRVGYDGYLVKENELVGHVDTLLKLKDISIPFQILLDSNTLYVGGGGYGGYGAYFSSVSLSDTILRTFKVPGVQILGIRRDNFGRLWLFGDNGIFLKEKDTIVTKYGR